jgi:formate dehydrogenase major subunit
MAVSRREFLKVSGATTTGAALGALAGFGLDVKSVEAAAKSLRIKNAKVVPGVCPYCAVGCAQLIYVQDNKIIEIEGDSDCPHTEGALCPKGSSTYQISVNEHRKTKVMYRAPGSDKWEEKSLDWAMSRIAELVKKTRDATFVEKHNNVTVNRCEGIASLGSAVIDNEENYLLVKLFRSLGIVNLDHQARICHSATVPALGVTYGRGAMTGNLIDVINSDVIMPTSNWAECHPVSYKWVMKAKERGAKIIHVDPRYTRTSATADIWAPIRSGTNIVFFGGLIRYAIEHQKYFHDYVVAYTNAAFLIDPKFKTPTDLAGLFTGYEPGKRDYDKSSWKYQLDEQGVPKKDPTLKDPHSVFQLLRRQYGRYTPEMVERVCGLPKEKFLKVAELYCSTGRPDKTGTIGYALQLNQSTNGVQQIRSLCMLQLLLGNIGVPGGGVTALRGHSNVQGASDMAALYNILPGYLALPLEGAHPTFKDYVEKETPKTSFWTNKTKFFVSQLAAFYGEACTKENDYAYDYLPKRIGGDAYSHQHIFVDMFKGKIKGFIVVGQNPGVDSPNAKMAREAMRRLDWLVVQDLFETETAAVWKAPEVKDPKQVKTEVFFLPGAPAAEKSGSITNTMRLLQWHTKAVDPPGDARSDAAFVHDLGLRLRKLYAGSKAKKDRPILDLVWSYGHDPKDPKVEPNMDLVLKEVNGYATRDITDKDGKLLFKKGQHLPLFTACRDDGSTACGNWIYSGVFPEPGKNLAARREKSPPGDYLAHNWAWSWPANRRILYNRASADPSGKPWSENKKLIWWDEAQKKWVGGDVPDFKGDLPPDSPKLKEGPFAGISGVDPFIMRGDGKGALFGVMLDGPFPEHYEPVESPTNNLLSKTQINPVCKIWDIQEWNKLAPVASPEYPIVLTTYRLTEHHAAGLSRHLPWLSELFTGHFIEMSHDLAKEKGIANGEWVTVTSARSKIQLRALVTDRFRPFMINGKKVHHVGIPWHWGYQGVMDSSRGDVTNDLVATVGDPNTFIQESKALMCDVKKGRV